MTVDPGGDNTLTVGRLLDQRARESGEREFLVAADRDQRWTYARFNADVDLAARGLLALGIRRGEHIAVLAPNVPEWQILHFAIAKVGAVLVALDPRWGAAELEHALAHSDATTLFLAARCGDADLVARLRDVVPEVDRAPVGHATFTHLPRLRRIALIGRERLPGMLRYDDLYELAAIVPQGEAERREAALSLVDIAAMAFTRGTTGPSKAVILSQRSLVLNAVHATARIGVSPADRVCCGLPYFRPLGFAGAGLGCVVRGATLVTTEDLDAVPVADAVAAERCNVLLTTPLLVRWIADLPGLDRRDFGHLRTILVGDDRCAPDDAQRAAEVFGEGRLAFAYGLVEGCAIVAATVTDARRRMDGSVGTPLHGVQVAVVDPQTGAASPAGTTGELRLRGHGNMRGYYKAPAATAAAIDDAGWLHTGDLGSLDERSWLRIEGRRAAVDTTQPADAGPVNPIM